jgi:hypothetical protein
MQYKEELENEHISQVEICQEKLLEALLHPTDPEKSLH